MSIEILSCGTEKVKAISVIREITGWSLKEAKDFVDSLEESGGQTLTDVSADAAAKLRGAGMTVRDAYDADDEVSSGENDGAADQAHTKYEPIVSSDMIAKLDREGTMKVLAEAGKIAKESEEYDTEIAQLTKLRNEETRKAEALRKAVSKPATAIIWLVTAAAFLVGLLAIPLCIVTGLAALILMNLTVKKADLKKHEAENNANADAYLEAKVAPIQTRLDEVHALRDELLKSGRRAWAVDVVGRDMFYSACIQDLYDLIKNRRADNLKEALNKYDDAQHKARMEEMQESIQNASEISAREAVKQTAYSKEIAKSSHQAATSAKATAYHTRQINKNTRKFR